MDVQFYGANCIVLNVKNNRIVIDDNLAALGGKTVSKADDIALFTGPHAANVSAKIVLDSPGEYEVADVSVFGIAAQAHLDAGGTTNATMFKLHYGDLNIGIVGHIYPDLSESQLESLGIIDVLFVPVGGNGFTLDPVGALKIIKKIEPKLVIPTHYDDGLDYEVTQQPLSEALKVLAMEPKETVTKLKLKTTELTDTTQLVILERS